MAKQRRVRARPARKRTTPSRRRVPPRRKVPKSAPPPPTEQRRPSYVDALSLYEQGVEALQRRDYERAGGFLRAVLERYPDEQELLDRARLYLRVCERQSSPPVALPQSAQERVYAATLSLNAGRYEEAVTHLRAVVDQNPDHDHAHYMLAVAHAMRGELEPARLHLNRAIELNPENRAHARHDPDFESMRQDEGFRRAVETAAPSRRRSWGRTPR